MSRPHRVLYVLNAPNGGATQGILEFLKGNRDTDVIPHVVVPTQPTPARARLLDELTAEWRVVPMSWWNRKVQLPYLRRLLVWGRESLHTMAHTRPVFTLMSLIHEWQIDIVHTGTVLNIEGAIAAKLTGRPHIWHIKETVGRTGRVRFLLGDQILFPLILGLSHRVLVMTEFIARPFRAFDNHNKVIVLFDGVDADQFAGPIDCQAIRRKLNLEQDELVVGMCASLSSTWKQHDLFIDMAASLAPNLPHVKFVAFGHEPSKARSKAYRYSWDYYQGLQARVQQHDLNGSFVWGGFHSDIPELMKGLDVLVHTCAIEPFGRIAIEAMAAGRPVVGPSEGGISESVVHETTGLLVEPGSKFAFAEATKSLIDNVSLRHTLGQAGPSHVKANFSIEGHHNHLLCLYDEVRSGA